MLDKDKKALVEMSWGMHGEVEAAYLAHVAKQGDSDWSDKQSLLLADMALHLLQTALAEQGLCSEKLRHNLNAILTISDHFLPQAELRAAADKLYQEP